MTVKQTSQIRSCKHGTMVCTAPQLSPSIDLREAQMPIRLVVVDDHPILRHGMRSLLADSHLIEVVGEAETGEEALSMVNKLQPDILLIDIDMPDISGIEVVKRLYY